MRYATVKSWVEYFDIEEDVQISQSFIRNRLRDAEIIGMNGRDRMGRLFKNSFFSEAEIRFACAEHLILTKVDKEGFFEKKGTRYGGVRAWSKVLPISQKAIQKYLQRSNAAPVLGRGRCGRKADLYSEPDVRSACASMINPDLPHADKTGFFEKDGVKYGTIGVWYQLLHISSESVKRNLKKSGAQPVKGKDQIGRLVYFYSEHDVRSSCGYLLEKLPQADKTGFFEKGGKKYGTAMRWSTVFRISAPTIKKYIKKYKISPVYGMSRAGKTEFFSETDILSACSDLLEKRKTA